jgi:hypothetical protein
MNINPHKLPIALIITYNPHRHTLQLNAKVLSNYEIKKNMMPNLDDDTKIRFSEDVFNEKI